eukprot:TRINITY_DN1829_c0_g1_i1.p1 TRINITY_DN1829_c0_g1~~TRINITY_DN1829_c0_g1_i1.p1  ORF type:complete len:293 (+),score=45.36 TRINITY_DN1829_c0_g1_i1:52-930(+)
MCIRDRGGLLADVFLHLLPHALAGGHLDEDGIHSHSHTHSHGAHINAEVSDVGFFTNELVVGLSVLLGILIFFVIEKIARSLHPQGHSHSHSHAHAHKKENKAEKADKKEDKDKSENDDDSKSGNDDDKAGNDEGTEIKSVKVAAYLNLLADTTHNFTDGMAIAASFLQGTSIGLTTMIAVFFHEIPHEIGDFAILVQSGFTRGEAMRAQLVTAIGAMLGTLLGLFIEGIGSSSAWILPVTAGGFIYIATVGALPELLKESSFGQTIKEVVAFSIGVLLMVGVAYLEENGAL